MKANADQRQPLPKRFSKEFDCTVGAAQLRIAVLSGLPCAGAGSCACAERAGAALAVFTLAGCGSALGRTARTDAVAVCLGCADMAAALGCGAVAGAAAGVSSLRPNRLLKKLPDDWL